MKKFTANEKDYHSASELVYQYFTALFVHKNVKYNGSNDLKYI